MRPQTMVDLLIAAAVEVADRYYTDQLAVGADVCMTSCCYLESPLDGK